ncbi:putative fimbrial assembly protein [Hyphomonas neptunium ATCC 15444]|uniref:Putative fimbrial assembly protein n=2 Tax=Hyphomonas TaxID=85 RepID=Q0BZA3_HYPNA|nr:MULTISPECIES: fimbria/pilus periplasmic chaperone [Hyphomonas]ABI78322.1 putative fimbrial assembly protein [Hyphomonas neptunium ATCC 15444]KCZ95279.1 putative fimbrial assembly protein [Hyphomonas hirschiana VP5]
MHIQGLIRLGALFLVSLALAGEALAFRLSPMRYILAPAGTDAEITLRLENTYPVDLPIEVEVFRRTITEDGKEVREPADDDFLVFPPQSLVPAGQEQAFRVRYVGPPSLDVMESYVVMFRQLPIRNRAEGNSGIDVMMALGTAAYVSPPGATANLSLGVEALPDNPDQIDIWVTNSGNAYGYVDQFHIRLQTEEGASAVIPPSVSTQGLETPLIMPNARRKLRVDIPETLSGQPIVSAEISALPAE